MSSFNDERDDGTTGAESAMVDALLARLRNEGTVDADRQAPTKWDRVRARLVASERRRFRLRSAAIAAGILIIATAGTLGWFVRRQAGADGANRGATAELQAIFNESRGALRPGEMKALSSGLRIIDRAIAETSLAATADPSDRMLAAYLARLEERRLEALREAVAVASNRLTGS